MYQYIIIYKMRPEIYLEFVKFATVKDIIKFSIINSYTFELLLVHNNYIGTLKLREINLPKAKNNLLLYNRIVIKKNIHELLRAHCINGNLETVKYLIDIGAKLYSDLIRPSLFYGRLEIVKYLISLKPSYASEALNYALERGDLKLVKYFLTLTTPTERDLNTAIICGELEIVKCLIDAQVFISVSAISTACEWSHLNIVKYLVDIEAPIPETILEEACMYRNLDLVEYLVSIIDPSERCLIKASISEDFKVFEFIYKLLSFISNNTIQLCIKYSRGNPYLYNYIKSI